MPFDVPKRTLYLVIGGLGLAALALMLWAYLPAREPPGETLVHTNAEPGQETAAAAAVRREDPPVKELPPLQPAAPERAEAPEAPAARLAVAAMGEVRRPGFYEMPEDSRVQDLIDRAGGATDQASLEDINIAARLIDGTTLTLPRKAAAERDGDTVVLRRSPEAADLNPPQYTRSGWVDAQMAAGASAAPSEKAGAGTAEPADAAATASSGSGLININTASSAQLETLPGIGPKTAGKIMQYRESTPFRSVEELDEVHGIGPAKLEAVRELVTVQ